MREATQAPPHPCDFFIPCFEGRCVYRFDSWGVVSNLRRFVIGASSETSANGIKRRWSSRIKVIRTSNGVFWRPPLHHPALRESGDETHGRQRPRKRQSGGGYLPSEWKEYTDQQGRKYYYWTRQARGSWGLVSLILCFAVRKSPWFGVFCSFSVRKKMGLQWLHSRNIRCFFDISVRSRPGHTFFSVFRIYSFFQQYFQQKILHFFSSDFENSIVFTVGKKLYKKL